MSEKKEYLKWNSKFIFQFFEIYKSYECLWNVNCEDYYNRDVRDASFNLLVENLQEEGFGVVTREKLKGKIKSLKDSFRIELNKVRKSMKSVVRPEDVYTPRLVWFSVAEEFWKDLVVDKESSTTLNITEDAVESRGDQSTSKESASPIHLDRKRPRIKTETPLRSWKLLKIIPPPRPERSDAPASKVTPAHHDDQFDKFAKHVASQLREMPMRSFIILQSRIQELISTERLRLIDMEYDEPEYSRSNIHSSTQELDNEECPVYQGGFAE